MDESANSVLRQSFHWHARWRSTNRRTSHIGFHCQEVAFSTLMFNCRLVSGSKERKRLSGWGTFGMSCFSLFLLTYGGRSLFLCGAAIWTGRLSLSVYWQGTRRGGGDHIWSEDPGMFLFAFLLLAVQGGFAFWMGWKLARFVIEWRKRW